MTLVIAQKFGNTISLSSDSRISFNNGGHIDFGIKIFSIPVKIFSPTDDKTGTSSLDYNYNLGLAVVGSTVNAYTIKESVSEILQHLQHVPRYTNYSMDGISKLIFKVFEKTTKELASILQDQGLCQLILGGYCPKQKKIRIFKYSVEFTHQGIISTLDEILQNDGLEFFGSCKTQAEMISRNNIKLSPLQIIREIIKGGQVGSVGGGLQYGEFNENNFKIYGVVDYALDDDGDFKEYLFTLRGINLYRDEFEGTVSEFHISYTFKRPFEQEVNKILDKYKL